MTCVSRFLILEEKNMMNYEIFKEVVAEKFMDYMPEKYRQMEVRVNPVNKVNVVYDGLSLAGENTRVSPTLYINEMYKQYEETGSLDETLRAAAEAMCRGFDKVPELQVNVDFSDAKDKIVFQLVNTEQNKAWLDQAPHREFQDLSIIYRYLVNAEADGMQSVKVTNALAEKIGFSEEQLFKFAAENTRRLLPPTVRSMNDVMKEIFVNNGMPADMVEMMFEETPSDMELWVISNDRGINGAVSMLYENELHTLAENLGSDLYILPSSVHEVLAISAEVGHPEELAQLVHDVNMHDVSLDERLSNQVYHYDKDLRKLTLATDTPNKRLDGLVAEPKLIYDAKGPSR